MIARPFFVNGAKFQKEVIFGVLQWSVLGPILFLVLISDINEEISESFLSSFADDNKINYPIGDQSTLGQPKQHEL